MWKVIVIPADNAYPIREETIKSEDTLGTLQKLVDGFIEHVRIGDCITRHAFMDVAMYVNEDGIAQGKSQNDRAAILYGVLIHGQGIYGDAVLTGECMDPIEGRDICNMSSEYTLDFWNDHYKKVAKHYSGETIPQ